MKKVFFMTTCLFIALLVQAQVNLKSGLVAYYPLNGNANDESGNGNNGIIFGGVTATQNNLGNANSAMLFNGIDGYLSVPSSTSLQSVTDIYTYSAWVNVKNWFSSSDLMAPILSKPDGSNNSIYWNLQPNEIFSTGSNYSTNFKLNTWYQITVSCNGVSVKYYLNGCYVGICSYTDWSSPNDVPLEIGEDSYSDLEFFNGIIDEIYIYNRVLNETEIKALYDNQFVTKDSVFTYNVTVPVETNACYISGVMNGWTFQQMTKIDATHYSISIKNSTPYGYKYCSGPNWAYVEKDEDGNELSNRSYTSNDVVANWASVFTDVKNTFSEKYQIFDNWLNWNEAKAYCESIGGHLATITSAEELSYILKLLESHKSMQYYWLGGTDEVTEGPWKWINGEKWEYTNWNLANGEPNNYYSNEDYLMLYNYCPITRGTWNDATPTGTNFSSSKFGFICEWDIPGIYNISPKIGNSNEKYIDIDVFAYPIALESTVELVCGENRIKADSILGTNNNNIKARFLLKNKQLGLYDALLISPTDTLKLEKSFRLVNLLEALEPTDTDNDGFRNISTLGNLVWITQHSESWSYKYELDTDLDGSETQYWNDGEGLNPITTFSGIFDGQSHKIRNLYYNTSGNDNVAFISTLASGGIVRNLGLANCSVTGNNYTAGLVANNSGTISNCYCSGTIAGYNNVGGITGNNNGTIKCSYNSSLITGNDYVGGLAGNSSSSSIISKSFNQGKVIGKDINIAGIIGSNSGTITDCYNAGSIIGAGETAGVAGWNYGTISNVYNRGLINGAGNAVGAIIGINQGSSLVGSFSDKEKSGGITSQYGVDGTNETTADMKTQSTYTNWDFTNTWEIIATMNDGYPQFTWSANPNRIKSYTPDRTANVDGCLITIEGSGFNDSTKVFLTKTGQTTIKADTLSFSDTYCTARFNLKNAAIGTWNILVQYPDTTIAMQNGLTIEEKKEGTLNIEIFAADKFRIGRPTSVTVRVTNTGNTKITDACIAIAVDSDDPNFTVYSENYNHIDKQIFDSLGCDVREFYFMKTQNLLGHNRDCKYGKFYLPEIPAYNALQLDISIKSNGDYTLATYQNDYSIDDFAKDAISIVYTGSDTYSYAKTTKYNLKKTASSETSSNNVCDKIYTNCWNDMMKGVWDALMKEALEELKGQLFDLVPYKPLMYLLKGGYDMGKLYSEMNKAAINGDTEIYNQAWQSQLRNGVKSSFLEYSKSVLMNYAANKKVANAILDGTIDNYMSTGLISRTEAKNIVRRSALRETAEITEKVNNGAELGGYLLSYGGVLALRAIQARQMCYSPVLKDCNIPDNSAKHSAQSVSSYDPNDKIGYRSPSGSRYFNKDNSNFTYEINFENKQTATAAAQEVAVSDTLDLNLFNVESFRAGVIKIGTLTYPASYNVQENKWQIDMRPAKNLITNVTLTLDKVKGIAKWDFKSVDPTTMDWPQDVTLGFLPPNDSICSGQGSVSFTIDLKSGLASDVTVKNKANIIFDNNAPIITPTWSNYKDIIAPTSKMLEPKIVSDSIATLSWIGEDNKKGSGVYRYNVYTKKANEAYNTLLSNTSLNSIDFKFNKNIDYAFFVTATDSAGNAEVKTNVPDVTMMVNVTAIPKVLSEKQIMNVFPNPSINGLGFYVTFNIPDQEKKHARLVITSMLGSVVKEIDLTGNKIHIEDIGKGMFIFDLREDGESVEHRKVVIQ